MNNELMARGEMLHQQYLADLEKATPEEIEAATKAVEEQMREYGHSFAAKLHEIVNS